MYLYSAEQTLGETIKWHPMVNDNPKNACQKSRLYSYINQDLLKHWWCRWWWCCCWWWWWWWVVIIQYRIFNHSPEHVEFLFRIDVNVLYLGLSIIVSRGKFDHHIYSPENWHVPWKSMVGRCIPYWNSPFLGGMLVFHGVSLHIPTFSEGVSTPRDLLITDC